MKKIFALFLTVGLLMTFALPATASIAVTRDMVHAAGRVMPSATSATSTNRQIRDVLRLTNNQRRMNFRPAVREHAALNAAAAVRAREAAQNWSHTRPNGQIWHSVLAPHGVTGFAHASENLARISGGANPADAARAVTSWMNSPAHRDALLGNHTHVGHGVYFHAASGTYFWAQIFMHDNTTRNTLGVWDMVVGVTLMLLRAVGL
ncbi:MAG: CAP domain-containing protein [Oscillospiraceae bacterium]|nr:CAP domain-containing protein [Oscillospiraceae bacterium]